MKTNKKDKLTILIVDDNAQNLQVLGELLSLADYAVALATSGFDALEKIQRIQCDLILLDIMMPDLDGYEVAKRLKSDPKTKEIPIIFLTAKIDSEDIVKGFQCGGADYVTKPFNHSELLARVNTQIENSRLRKEIANQNRKLEESNSELSSAVAELGTLNSNKDKFIAMAAYDVKSPIDALAKAAEMLAGSAVHLEKEDIAKIALNLNERAAKISALVDKLIDWSKYNLGSLNLKPNIIELRWFFKVNIDYLNLIAQEKNIKIDNMIPGNAFAYFDKAPLEIAVRNLLANAIKYSKPNGRIRIESIDLGDYAEIYIKDEGVGFTQEKLEKLFKHGSDGEEKIDDSVGPGIFIAKDLIEKNKGALRIESEQNNGATVIITLPTVG